jgi:prepilin-type N-terminal cleavage/methylation domain-containing protein
MFSYHFLHKGINKKKNKGFTLIELLVVIGILGVLASALVATIDPFEQLKKAADANIKNTAVEYIDANIRYYTAHTAMPWSDVSNTSQTYASACNTEVGGVIPFTSSGGTATTLNNFQNCLQTLIYDGEIKSSFTNVTNVLQSLYVSGSSNSVTVCFIPSSKSQKNDPNTKWNASGSTTVAGCPNPTSNTCYWCSQ